MVRAITQLPVAPTLHPTAAEFEDPIEYLSQRRIVQLGLKYGLVKLIPPKSFQYDSEHLRSSEIKFTPRFQTGSELQIKNRAILFFNLQLKHFHENIGIQFNEVPVHTYSIFIDLIRYFNKMDGVELALGRFPTWTNFPNLILPSLDVIYSDMKFWESLEDKHPKLIETFNKYLKRYYRFLYLYNADHSLPSVTPSEESISLLDNETSSEAGMEYPPPPGTTCSFCLMDSTTLLECKTCNNWLHYDCFQCKYPPEYRSNLNFYHCHECVLGNTIYGFRQEDSIYTIDKFREICKQYERDIPPNELEETFWRRVNYLNHSLTVRYGADIPYPTGTTNSSTHPMNLINLPKNKRSLLRHFTTDNRDDEISGMTLPWIYVGARYSTFCWHMEDHYTMSANYQIEGKPKVWYSVPPTSTFNFGRLLYNITPDLFTKDPNMIHQLTSLISPYDPIFKKYDVEVFKIVQNPGEFIITFPQCYHAGFNTGFNINEAVNFTTDFWIDFGMRAMDAYKVIHKSCVFDMYWLFLMMIREYVESKSKQIMVPQDISLAYQYLVPYINTELRHRSQLMEKGVALSQISGSKHEIVCSTCQTICSFTYCLSKQFNPPRTFCLEHSFELTKKNNKSGSHLLSMHSLQDMEDIIELLKLCGNKLDQ